MICRIKYFAINLLVSALYLLEVMHAECIHWIRLCKWYLQVKDVFISEMFFANEIIFTYGTSFLPWKWSLQVTKRFHFCTCTEIQWNLATLSHGVRYYTTVTACNAIELCTEVTSDGILVDVMPPIAGLVWDGSGDWDISFQGERWVKIIVSKLSAHFMISVCLYIVIVYVI